MTTFSYDDEMDILYINCDKNSWPYNRANHLAANIEYAVSTVPKEPTQVRMHTFTKNWSLHRVSILHFLRDLYDQTVCDELVEFLTPVASGYKADKETLPIDELLQGIKETAKTVQEIATQAMEYFEKKQVPDWLNDLASIFKEPGKQVEIDPDPVTAKWINGELYWGNNRVQEKCDDKQTLDYLKKQIRDLAKYYQELHGDINMTTARILNLIGEKPTIKGVK